MGKWIISVTDQLQHFYVNNAEDNGRRMASALTIVAVIDDLTPNHMQIGKFPFANTETLLSYLSLRPNMKECACSDLDFVYSLIPSNSRKSVSDAVVTLCNELSHNKLLQSPQWLYAIPLVHFLRGTSKPFKKLPCDPKNIAWVDGSFGLSHVRERTNDKTYG